MTEVKRQMARRITLMATLLLALLIALGPSAVALACSGKIIGYKFHDLNGNGVWDNGEPGLPGWTIKYKRVGQTTTYTKTTDSTGKYQFSDVDLDERVARQFDVWEQIQSGWYASTPDSVRISLVGEGDYETVNFGNLMPGALQIKKTWYQGDQEVTPPATPATICVRRTGPGTPAQTLIPQDAAGNALAPSEINGQTYYCQQVTGSAAFINLWPGTYEVLETNVPAGWEAPDPVTVEVQSGNIGLAATTIVFGSNSYSVQFLGRQGNTWSYYVKELGGKNLSHIAFEVCAEIVDFTPKAGTNGVSSVQKGYDATTGISGIKWNFNYSFREGTFSFTLNGDYPMGQVRVGAKAGTSYGTGTIIGPVCSGANVVEVRNEKHCHGRLEITKVVNWNGVTPDTNQTFQICISGPSYPTGDCQTYGYNGGTLAWENLEPGDYTITETAPVGFWAAPVIDPATGVVTVVVDQTATATVTNAYVPGSLQVTKVVNWSGVTPQIGQTFEICITGPSYPSGACQTADYDGAVLAWSNLIPGTYTVAETNPGANWTVTGSGVTVNVPSGGAGSAEVTNTFLPGSLTVTKTVDWNGVTPVDGQAFTVCIKGPSFPTGNEAGACQVVSAPDWSAVWSPLLPGQYTVSEQGPGDQWTVVVTGSPVNVQAGGQATASVTNTRKLGSLEVTKVVNWGNETPDPGKTFTICIQGPSFPTGSEAGACQTAGYSGAVLTWSNLIPGEYQVSEQDPGADWTVTGTGVVAVPANGGQACATVTNTLLRGALVVTKVVNWNGVTPDTTQTFEICVTPVGGGTPDCKTIGYAGGSLTWDLLPPGNYIVTESALGAEWSVTVAPEQVTVVDGQTATATVTNTRKLGGLDVTKVVNWNGMAPVAGQSFEICLTGPSFPTGTEAGACQTVSDANWVASWADLIPGTYTVAEPGLAEEWLTDLPQNVDVPTDGSTATFTANNTFDPGSLTVQKNVYWGAVTPQTGQTFTICIQGPSFPQGNEAGACQTVDFDGGSLTWSNLLPGDYTVSEVSPGASWDVQGSGVTVTVKPGTKAAAEGQDIPEIDNTFLPGQLIVQKVVDWGQVPANENQSFTICIQGPSFPQGTEDGACQTVDFDGGYLAWFNLIPGTYTISEVDPGSLWQVSIVPATVEVLPGAPAPQTLAAPEPDSVVTNRRIQGGLVVTKVVNWNGVDPVEGQSFQICITGPSFPQGDCQTVTYDGVNTHYQLVWEGLEPGTYTITEPGLGAEWTANVPQNVSVPGNGTAAQATVTNTHLLGALTVEKQVEWNRAPVDETRTFEICVSGPSFQTPVCRQFQDGDSYTWTELIPGAYTVTETPPVGDSLTWVVEVVYEPAGAEVATVVAGGEAKVVVINTTDTESPPTAVRLESWNVQGGAGVVTHTFTTAFEEGTLSFRLYRGESLEGAALVGEVNARGAASTYEILDKGLEAGRYTYWLV
ncbi:MAG: MSCRAMM family protein, partial [Anaerolineae bacterium]